VADVAWPLDGVPVAWQVPLTIGLVISVAMLAWSASLFTRAQRARVQAPPAPHDITNHFFWIFLVPALNEEVTIADSVQRLEALKLAYRRIVVIDDGSTDRTPEILAGIDHPDLVVMRRDPPNARQGKAAALNDAYRRIAGMIGQADRRQVIVVIVDADGRLDLQAPRYAAAHFMDPDVAGVQALVCIYNRWKLLAWMQHNEFAVYGHLFQTGRNSYATAGMGGNGQFNRLSALDCIADHKGPWRDKLTEDQDLGLRLLGCGLLGRQELRASVDQQGLSNLRPLFRQRTRWSQGNLQAISLIGEVWRAPLTFGARLELVVYLLMPVWQGLVGFALTIAMVFLITGVLPIWDHGPAIQLLLVYLLAFGGTVLGTVAARATKGPVGWLHGFLLGHLYAAYTWMLWPVLLRSSMRQLTERREWAKTEREALEPQGRA
jgi:cellulose synthase/poly-beta-1,6-N-acetylglucosamine synthase-like glycosyltransferase